MREKSARGFALVVAVSLMVLLLLLCVSILSLATVSIRQTNTDDAMLEAQANARMAMMIAIGELQECMGPDRRISARASTIGRDPRVGVAIPTGSPRAWWVGVVGSDSDLGLDAMTSVSSANPAAKWLISGLNPTATAATQLSQPFDNPIIMYDEHSIDLSLTGGQPMEAGIVRVEGAKPGRIGGYAYIVDDEGLKAALAPSRTDLVNTSDPPTAGDLTPGAYDVSVLDGMSALAGNPLVNYAKILSTGDLALIGGDNNLAASKRFGFTTYSRGVLCDVKNGGLKRDLTVAFEDDATFNEVFPRGSGNYTADYLCIDPAKLAASPELQQNGYIHWEVFKDFYNIKRHIKTHTDGVTKYLDPVRYSKAGVYGKNNGDAPGGWTVNPEGSPSGGAAGSLLMAGRLGPHQIGDAETVLYPEMEGMPYGDYQTMVTTPRGEKNCAEFKHSPVIPILQRMQVNAWLEYIDNRTFRTHCQMWSSHYNPYNISLNIMGDDQGPRIIGAPRVTASTSPRLKLLMRKDDGGQKPTYLDQQPLTHNKAQFHAVNAVMALPGRSHVLAYERSGSWNESADGQLYNDVVQNLTTQSIIQEFETMEGEELPDSLDLKIRMPLMNTSLHHGSDDNLGGGGNFEVSQSFWAPFAWDNAHTASNERPGKLFDFGSVATATLNENRMASLTLSLRTSRESDDAVRPLVDANIRCLFGNTRWDSPLGLPVLASYSTENQGEADEMIMQMNTVDAPKGYSYWGAGREPSFGYDRVILFDIARTDLVSLGQLQHAGAGRFSYEPTYIVGNSYANPRISQTNWRESVTDTFSTPERGLGRFAINGNFNLYDASYLVNEVLWDGYTFTTIPQIADNVGALTEPVVSDGLFEDLASGDAGLPNARYIPYTPNGSSFERSTLQMASNKANRTGAFYHNAGHLLVDGAFNVNSTSVDAWEAFLSSTHSLPVAKMNQNGEVDSFEPTNVVRFPRVQTVFGEGVRKSDMDEDFWIGFRELEQIEVRELAQAIVDEIGKRGPFLSMGEFVNRKLENGELGEAGALQAALDNTVNLGIDTDFARNEQGAGFPGQLLQGDILQALSPRMTVRSDVFTIRTYGESVNADNGRVLARAWCEAKVQRFPDPISWGAAGSGDALRELSNPSSPFGREFRLISFRWLNPEEL